MLALLVRRAPWPLSVFAAAMLVLAVGSLAHTSMIGRHLLPEFPVPGGALARGKRRNLAIVLGTLALSGWYAGWLPFISNQAIQDIRSADRSAFPGIVKWTRRVSKSSAGAQMREEMSDYETKAWSSLLDLERKRRNGVKARAADKVSAVVKRAGEHIKKVPGAELALEVGDETIVKAIEGLFKSVFLPAMHSPSLDKRVEELRGKHQDLDRASPFTSLDLKGLDKGRPTFAIPFIGMAESAAASLAITGFRVGKNVSDGPSAEVVLGTVVADVGATLALLGRAVGGVAVHYGYDPREPEEELFLMGVLNYSMASTATSKTPALASLSRLTQSMMRRATWNELRGDSLVQMLLRVFGALGLKLTKAQLARLVPIAGVLLTAGLSFNLLHSTIDDATRLYRARYLAEKHGLSLDEWITAPEREREPGAIVDATVVEIDGALCEITAS